MSVCATDDLGNESGELSNGHMPGETMVIDPVRAVVSVLDDLWIL